MASIRPASDYLRQVAIFCAGALCTTPLSAANPTFPYVAYVNEADAYIRSGPGNEHYPTGQLPAGFAVEVYRHDGDGWCAIRPPEGSFSLAPAHQVRTTDGRTAEVVATGVVARVGSSLGAHRNAVQVLLDRGEEVQLAEKPVAGDPWVKITPPAGEFRWIAARRLSRTPPVESGQALPGGSQWHSQGTLGTRSQTQSSAPSEDSSRTPETGQFDHLAAAPLSSSAGATPTHGDALWQPKAILDHSTGAPVAGGLPGEAIQVVAGSPAQVQLAQHQAEVDPALAAASSAQLSDGESAASSGRPRVRFPKQPAGPLDERVAELQLRLSQVVLTTPGAWQLGPLREETAALLAQEQSPQVREQFRDLLERVAAFESVQARYRSAPATGAVAATSSVNGKPADAVPAAAATSATSDVLARVRSDLGVEPGGVTPTPGGQGAAQPATQALYDAVGTLKPVVSRREQAPRFALVDDHGDVVTFVTASSDVNLQSYVGKRIGVRGSRGFMPEYRRAHVLASRVTPLEEKLVK